MGFIKRFFEKKSKRKGRRIPWAEAMHRFFDGTLVDCFFLYNNGERSEVITKNTRLNEFFMHYGDGGAFYERCSAGKQIKTV